MLLIDQHRRVRSVSDRDIRGPYVYERLWNDAARARALFGDRVTDAGCLHALAEEVARCGGTVPSSLTCPDALIDVAMRAMACGTIVVATLLPNDVAVAFDEERPFEWYEPSMVQFAGSVIVEAVATCLLNTLQNRQAFEAALAHPLAQSRAKVPPMRDVAGHFSGPLDRSATLESSAAWLLATRNLALIPRDLSRQRLRLVWIEQLLLPAVGPAPAPAPPPPAAPSPSPSLASSNDLPDIPDELSAQAQALIEAAESGAPFCEECARRAAELANA